MSEHINSIQYGDFDCSPCFYKTIFLFLVLEFFITKIAPYIYCQMYKLMGSFWNYCEIFDGNVFAIINKSVDL